MRQEKRVISEVIIVDVTTWWIYFFLTILYAHKIEGLGE